MLLPLLISCNQNETQKSTETITSATTTNNHVIKDESQYKNPLLIEYIHYLNKQDTTYPESVTNASNKFKIIFNHQDTSLADTAYTLFYQLYEAVDLSLNNKISSDTTNYLPLSEGYEGADVGIVSDKAKQFNEQLRNNGFMFKAEEGNTYIDKDRSFISNNLYPYLSADLKEYLTELEKENSEGFQVDAGLTISPETYTNRVIWWENFIKNHPHFIYSSEANKTFRYYLTFYLVGMDNTRLLESDTLSEYFSYAYTYLGRNFTDSKTYQLVNPYYQAILKKDGKKMSALLDQYKNKDQIIDLGANGE